jgi:hypothetical protein
MARIEPTEQIYDLRLRPKDLGVALVAALCLLGGWLLMQSTLNQSRNYAHELTPLRFSYPARWVEADSPENVLLTLRNPVTPSTFKTTISIENRPIDPASPPSLQTLLDRRIEQRQQLLGYQFITDREGELGGARALVSEYAYVVQPIDEARREALPVVVRAREYIVITADQSYYFSLVAPETVYNTEQRQFERLVASARVE